MFAIIRTRWQTRPLSRRAKRRSSAAPGSLRKKYAGIAYPPNMVRLPNHSTTSGDPRKPVLLPDLAASLCRLVAHPTVEEHAQRCDEGEGLVQHDVVSRLGHLDDGRLRTHQGRHVGSRFTRDERALFAKDEHGATTDRLQILAHGLTLLHGSIVRRR